MFLSSLLPWLFSVSSFLGLSLFLSFWLLCRFSWCRFRSYCCCDFTPVLLVDDDVFCFCFPLQPKRIQATVTVVEARDLKPGQFKARGQWGQSVFVCMCMYVCVRVCVFVCVYCVCVHAFVRTYVCACARACV